MTPTLIVASGPPGSGKTTLAHKLAAALGCPAISRDEIKQGMAHATPGFTGAPGDEMTRRTLPVFFAVLDLLLRSGVTTVAEAAFQDHVWRPELDKLRNLAEIRVVHCTVDAGVAFDRITRREQDDPLRRVHAAAPRDGRARGGAPRVPPGERRRARARGRHERRIPSPVRPDPVLRGWTGELDSERAEVPASATLIAARGRAPGRPARRPPAGRPR